MRRIEQILRHPWNDDEERIADEHIRAECERIQAGWTDEELQLRRIGDTRGERFAETWVAPTVAWLGRLEDGGAKSS